jgi:hypothetical protein
MKKINVEKVRLFRKGRLVGIVRQDFHQPEMSKNQLWDKLEIQSV